MRHPHCAGHILRCAEEAGCDSTHRPEHFVARGVGRERTSRRNEDPQDFSLHDPSHSHAPEAGAFACGEDACVAKIFSKSRHARQRQSQTRVARCAISFLQWQFVGDTNTAYDPTGHLLVVLEGNFEEEQPTELQMKSLRRLVAFMGARHGITPEMIGSHKDFAETLCPGKHLQELIPGIKPPHVTR